MPRKCTKCRRVVAEAAYCPFCSEPTIEHIPVPEPRGEGSEVRTVLTEFQGRNSRWVEFVPILVGPILLVGLGLKMFAPIIALVYCVLLGAGLFVTLLRVQLSACPCPRCAKNLAHLTEQNIRYCPFCGADLAVEIYPALHELTEFLKEISGQRGLEITNTDIPVPPGKQPVNTDIQPSPEKDVERATK